ncbi:MAG: hypothetical protein ACLP1X_03190 [Polyangiaceae bacterium]|jgi:hypothetical protein
MTPLLSRLLALATIATIAACGGKGAATGREPKRDIDSDPLAMLPPSAVVVARLDLRAVYADPSLGPQIAAITDPLIPVGDGSGFLASRDIDRVVVGVYATPGAQVAAVLSGRFDADRIAHAPRTTGGAPIVGGSYGGFATSSVGGMTFVTLTPKTVVAGTNDGVRFVLDRLHQGAPERSLPPWIVETLETPGVTSALAADFASQPVAAATLTNVNLPWLNGMRIARVIGNMQPPGLNVAATVTYGDPTLAQSAAGGMQSADRWLELFGPLIGGMKLQGFDASAEGNDLRCRFALDTQGLHTLLAMLPRILRPPSP